MASSIKKDRYIYILAQRKLWKKDDDEELPMKIGKTDNGVEGVHKRFRDQNTNPNDPLDLIFFDRVPPCVTDKKIHQELKKNGNRHIKDKDCPAEEWYSTSVNEVKAIIKSIINGEEYIPGRYLSFELREYQQEAVDKIASYYRGLVNARSSGASMPPIFMVKMAPRSGKTFTVLSAALEIGAKVILVDSFYPAAFDEVRRIVNHHERFKGYRTCTSKEFPDLIKKYPEGKFVVLLSCQDLLGRTEDGSFKDHNLFIKDYPFDCVIHDEAHHGIWRRLLKKMKKDRRFSSALVHGRDNSVLADDSNGLTDDDDLLLENDLSESEQESLADILFNIMFPKGRVPMNLFLSGTPFNLESLGSFSESQVFSYTYLDRKADEARLLRSGKITEHECSPELVVHGIRSFLDDESLRTRGEGRSAEFIGGDFDKILSEFLLRKDRSSRDKTPFYCTDGMRRTTLAVFDSTAQCYAAAKVMTEKMPGYEIVVVSGSEGGSGGDALTYAKERIRDAYGKDRDVVLLTCGKLMTGVTIPEITDVLFFSGTRSPVRFFQAIFRAQSDLGGSSLSEEPRKNVKKHAVIYDFWPDRCMEVFFDLAKSLVESGDARNVRDGAQKILEGFELVTEDYSSVTRDDGFIENDLLDVDRFMEMYYRSPRTESFGRLETTDPHILMSPGMAETVFGNMSSGVTSQLKNLAKLYRGDKKKASRSTDEFEDDDCRGKAKRSSYRSGSKGRKKSSYQKKASVTMSKNTKDYVEGFIQVLKNLKHYCFVSDYKLHSFEDFKRLEFFGRDELSLFKSVVGIDYNIFCKIMRGCFMRMDIFDEEMDHWGVILKHGGYVKKSLPPKAENALF